MNFRDRRGSFLARALGGTLGGLTSAMNNGLAHDARHFGNLIHTHEGVHLGHELGQFLPKTLRQTAGNNQRLPGPLRLAVLGGFQNGVNAFLLRGVDEGTSVDDKRIGLARLVGDLQSIRHQRAEHDLGVHQIFCAAKRDEPHAGWGSRFALGRFGHGRASVGDAR